MGDLLVYAIASTSVVTLLLLLFIARCAHGVNQLERKVDRTNALLERILSASDHPSRRW